MRRDRLDTAPCGLLRLSDDGTIRYTNAPLRDLLGLEAAPLSDQHINVLLTPGARIFYQTHVFPLLRAQGRVDEVYLSMRSADGAEVPVLINAVRHEAKALNDWVVVAIRRRSRFEDELLQARKAAQEANRAKDRFLSMLSHDVRTPLSGIRMAASLLGSGAAGAVTDRQREELHRIEEASGYVLRLVKDLLTYARLDAKRAEAPLEPVIAGEVTGRAALLTTHLAEGAGLTLTVEEADADAVVWAAPDRLLQILLNLLANAVKFSDRGGRVTLAHQRDGDHVLLLVRDTGGGIAADRLDSIFEPFVQLHGSGGEDGSVGLGLAISRELARLMGGDLTVVSQVGEGSTFLVRLAAAPAPPESSKERLGSAGAPHG